MALRSAIPQPLWGIASSHGGEYARTCAAAYSFAFNGKENDNEVHGATGTFQDYGMRAYDTRVGRFFSVDPMSRQFPFYTPYQFAGNKPTIAKDLDGLEEWIVTKYPFGDGTGRLAVFVTYVDEVFRRVDANGQRVNGVDYYLSNRQPDGSSFDYHTNTFINPAERRISRKRANYYVNPGRNQGTGRNQAGNFSLAAQHTKGAVGARGEGDVQHSMGQYADRDGNTVYTAIGGMQPIYEFSAYFETNITNRSTFAAEVNMNIDAMAQAMINDPSLNLTITGYASKDGTDEYNRDLSQQRANFITGALQQSIAGAGSNIDITNRVTVDYKGNTQAAGGAEADIPTDRRVDVRLQ